MSAHPERPSAHPSLDALRPMKLSLRIASASAVAFCSSPAPARRRSRRPPRQPRHALRRPPRAAPQLPADPWPRVLDLANAQVLVYQPQVNKWDGNQIDFRAAVAIKPTGAKEETFGVIFATARTQVDKVARTVVFEDLKITQDRLPDAAEPRRRLRGRAAEASSRAKITHDLARPAEVVAGARRHQAADGRGAEQPAAGDRQLFAGDPGADRRRAGAEAGAERLAVPARDQHPRADPARRARADSFYIHVYDGWLMSIVAHGPVDAAVPAAVRHGRRVAQSSRRRAPSTCSTAAPRPIPSRRSPTASRRSTRARCRPS